MPCTATLGQGIFKSVMQKQNILHRRGRELSPGIPWHLMAQAAIFLLSWGEGFNSLPCPERSVFPASSMTAVMISL